MTMNKEKRSGDPTIDRNHDYYKRTWDEIIDKKFVQTVFVPYPALVNKEPVNGWRRWGPYDGGQYDHHKYEVVKGMWDHEHCCICNFRIREGHSYWFNEGQVRLLCDECYQYYRKP